MVQPVVFMNFTFSLYSLRVCHFLSERVWNCCQLETQPGQFDSDNTGQQNLTFFFGTRGKISNTNRTFNAQFECVSSFSPSPTVCL